MADLVLSWSITYLMHSTILLVIAWLVAGSLSADRAREIVWKSAIVGGVVTATLALAMPSISTREVRPAPTIVASTGGARLSAEPDVRTPGGEVVEPARLTPPDAGAAILRHRGAASAVIAGIMAIGGVRLGCSLLAFRRGVRGRAAVTDPDVLALLDRLRDRAGVRHRVRLTQDASLRSPIAFGVWRPEICLPTRAVDELTRVDLQCVLAHELAHLRWRDPLWSLVSTGIAWILAFQPLNLVAATSIRRCAEFRCDDAASSQTGAIAFADSLVRIGQWMLDAPSLRRPTMCPMIPIRTELGVRVARLLGPARRVDVPAGLRIVSLSVLLLCAVAAPAFIVPAQPVEERGDLVAHVHEHEFAHVADRRLHVSNPAGIVLVKRSKGKMVRVVATARAETEEDARSASVTAGRREDGTLQVDVQWPESVEGQRRCDIVIETPGVSALVVDVASGSVTVDDLAAPADVTVASGSARILGSAGAVRAKVTSGLIDAKGDIERLDAGVMSGSIHIAGAHAFDAEVNSGRIAIELGSRFADAITASVGLGRLSVDGESQGRSMRLGEGEPVGVAHVAVGSIDISHD